MCLAVPGRICSIHGDTPETRSGKVDFGGVRREINLAFVPEAAVDDFVMVHVGFGISVVDEAEAKRVWDLLDQLGETGEFV
jgi:hydrogenase expression/formation protein HypC